MKKLFTLAALCTLAATSYAQTAIKAGTVQLGGSVNYSQQTSDSPYNYYTGSGQPTYTTQHYTNKGFSVNPSVGYFVADNLAIGLNLGYGRTKVVYSYDNTYNGYGYDNNEQRSTQLGLGAFVQYYHMFTDQFGVAGTLSGGYNHTTQRYSSGSTTSATSNGYSGALTPSLVFFPVPKFALGASVGSLSYSHSTSKSDGGFTEGPSSGSFFGANFGLSYLAFSGTYYFGR